MGRRHSPPRQLHSGDEETPFPRPSAPWFSHLRRSTITPSITSWSATHTEWVEATPNIFPKLAPTAVFRNSQLPLFWVMAF